MCACIGVPSPYSSSLCALCWPQNENGSDRWMGNDRYSYSDSLADEYSLVQLPALVLRVLIDKNVKDFFSYIYNFFYTGFFSDIHYLAGCLLFFFFTGIYTFKLNRENFCVNLVETSIFFLPPLLLGYL